MRDPTSARGEAGAHDAWHRDPPGDDVAFARRVVITLALACLFIVAGWLFGAFPRVPLLFFAAVLGAIALSGMAEPLEAHLRLPRGVAVVGIVLVLLLATAGVAWVGGPSLTRQVSALLERLPSALENLRSMIVQSPWGARLLSDVDAGGFDLESISSLVGGLFGPLASAFGVTISALSAAVVCVVMAVFMALEPQAYLSPLVLLVRPRRRQRVREIAGRAGRVLRAWLLGRIVSMCAVAALTYAGLLLLGSPEALLLAVIAGLLSFVPYIGPVLAAVPAVLGALGEGQVHALGVVALYAMVQLVEGNLLTPLIERRSVSLPPGVVVAAQLLLGVAFGFLGVLLATPIVVTTIVAVQGFYLEGVLGEELHALGEPEEEKEEPAAADGPRDGG